MPSTVTLLWRWRVPEFIGLVVTLAVVLLAMESMSEYQQFVPLVNVEGANGYPVRLGSELCSASELAVCVLKSSPCCKEMQAGTPAGETVPSVALWMVCLVFPVVFILARQGLTKGWRYQAVGTLPGAGLGLLFALGMCLVVTDGIKKSVGRPRPNYAALRALVRYGGSGYADLKGKSVRSFPSGHASESMAGTAFVTFLCWADLSRQEFSDRKTWRRTLLAALSCLPLALGLYVGITRIRDYWHFQDDVMSGWVIGATSAAVAVYWVTLPRRQHQIAVRSDACMQTFQRSGALAFMTESGAESESDTDGARVHGSTDIAGMA